MAARIPAPKDDPEKRLRLLRLVVDALGTQAEAARVIGVAPSALSQWLSGRSEPEGWHVVFEAVRRTLIRKPELEAAFVEALVLDLVDARGTWVPDSGGTGDWATEGSEAVSELGDLHRAMRSGSPDEIEASARSAIRETHEAAVVALGVAQARRGKVA